MLADRDVRRGQRAAGLEVDIEIGAGLDVAAAGHG
jgi:hypothetical protein